MINRRDLTILESCYPFIDRLPSSLLQAILSDGQRLSLPAGRRLFDMNGPCNSFLMLVDGTIKVYKPTLSGREIVLYRLQPGDSCILTVSCLLGKTGYPARGCVEQDLVAYAISRPLFVQMLEQSGPFREFVFHFFAERITQLMELLEDVGFRQLDQRLAAWLVQNGPCIECTHQAVADELGSVREVVSRILKDFECRSLVELQRSRIRVVDRSGLEKIAGFLGDSSH